MASITRLYDFAPFTLIQSAQVDEEFNQLIDLLSGVISSIGVVLTYSHASEPPLILNQTGGGELFEVQKNGTRNFAISTDGRVGINLPSTPPVAQLDVRCASSSTATLNLVSSGISTVALITGTLAVDDTATVAPLETIAVNSGTGAAAAGFGARKLYQLESSTTDAQDAAYEEFGWLVATHAARTSYYDIGVESNAKGVQRGLRVLGDTGAATAWVNWVQVRGSSTATSVDVRAEGETNVGIDVRAKAAAAIRFFSNSNFRGSFRTDSLFGLSPTTAIGWSGTSNDPTATIDTGLARAAAGIVRVESTTGAIGKLTSALSISPLTSGATLLAADSGTVTTNEGASARLDMILPSAVAGYRYSFIVQDTDGIRVTAGTGDTIRIGSSVSASAGRIDANTIGASITLVAINATEWVALGSPIETWTVT